jgi:hypothetical protein
LPFRKEATARRQLHFTNWALTAHVYIMMSISGPNFEVTRQIRTKGEFLKVIYKFDLYLATHSCWQMSQWIGVVIRSNPPWNNNGCISNYKTSNVTFNSLLIWPTLVVIRKDMQFVI